MSIRRGGRTARNSAAGVPARADLRRRLTLAALVAMTATALLAAFSSSALAGQAWWQLTSSTKPTYLKPGGEGQILVRAINLGDASVYGTPEPVTITDTLPEGIEATTIEGRAGVQDVSEGVSPRGEVICSLTPSPSCTWEGEAGTEPLQPFEEIEVTIGVKVDGAPSGAVNEAQISGGLPGTCEQVGRFAGQFSNLSCRPSARVEEGEYEVNMGETPVSSVTTRHPMVISSETTPFGVAGFGLAVESSTGTAETQAGAHPFQLTTLFTPNQGVRADHPPALLRNVKVELPPGLVGNAPAIPRCSEIAFTTIVSGNTNLCPADSQVGVTTATVVLSVGSTPETAPDTLAVPIYNLVPSRGEPARFGFEVEKVPAIIDTAVRTGGDYGVTASVNDLSQAAGVVSSTITLWGVPTDPRHDASRGWSCIAGGQYQEDLATCVPERQAERPPFLTLPTACDGPLVSSVQAEPWNESPAVPRSPAAEDVEPSASQQGCGLVPFGASISAEPDAHTASTPTGLTVDVHVAQDASRATTGIADSSIKDVAVTFPEGLTLNPAAAGGLDACSIPEVGFQSSGSTPEQQFFTSGIDTPFCPEGSKIGSVTLTTPILKNPLKGYVYLAAQNENPFGSLTAVYLVAEDPESGVLVKLAGDVTLDQATGRVQTTFKSTPQDPIETIEMHIFGGERAPFSTPAHCGTYTTSASFVPWSGDASVNPTAGFAITSGPAGGPCPGTLPFSPSLAAGTTNATAGAFAPFTSTISREDGSQDLEAVDLTTPPGFSGILTNVPLCTEAQADEGTCAAGSLIGETTARVGLGGSPYSLKGGRVYITGPYAGAPFGLSIAMPAKAGPYDLGRGACDCIVVRAKLQVDPHTAQLTVATDTSGAFKIPTILDGIPVQLKSVNVTINRPGFTFNPTNCSPLAITGTALSSEGATASLSEPFTAVNCATLGFAPKLTASTSAHSSKALGASLTTKLTYPNAPFGTQSNIAKVKVDLPVQLPSELKTLQKACLAAVFEANPANCPAASIVGHATVHTPVLPVPLTGPAYFVSHGGEEFPSLIMVLQGYGVTFDLVGATHIKKGITSSTFSTVPDVPVSTFELTLPQGKFSALASNLPAKANGSFCGQKMKMPTLFVAQNGLEIHGSTPLTVTGCAKAKKPKKVSRKGKHIAARRK